MMFRNAAFFFIAASLVGTFADTVASRGAPDNSLGVAILSAVVAGDGTLARGTGAVSASRAAGDSSGGYYVTFDRDLNDCITVATIGGTDADTYAGSHAQATVLLNVSQAWVHTSDGADNLVDRPF